MNLLESKNIIYVIRIKNNCIHLDKNKNSKNESVKIIKKIECNIATNLYNNYSDIDIKNIYLLRWSVEEYFKFIKKNFRFSHLTEHNKKTKDYYEKLYIIIQIYSLLIDILEYIYESHYKRVYNNKKIMIEGIAKIINNIINFDLTEGILYRYYKCFIDITYSIKNTHNSRVS